MSENVYMDVDVSEGTTLFRGKPLEIKIGKSTIIGVVESASIDMFTGKITAKVLVNGSMECKL